MRVTILDYGAGNMHSLAKVVARSGSVTIEADPARAVDTDFLVLPGVGAFAPAAAQLAHAIPALRAAIDAGLPTLGICLGMQLLFESSEEGAGTGLGVIAGRVTRLDAARIPQIGWNAIDESSDPTANAVSLTTAYYANGFACRPADASYVTAWSAHDGDRFPAIVRRGSVVGVQFHPEKSSVAGVAFIDALLREARP